MKAEGKIEVFSFYRPFEGKGDSIAPFKATAQYLQRFKLNPVEGSGEMVLVSRLIDGELYEPKPEKGGGQAEEGKSQTDPEAGKRPDELDASNDD